MDDASKPVSWSRGRWLLTIGLVFIAHLGLLIAFSAAPKPPRALPAPPPAISLILDGSPNAKWLADTAIHDPTTLALPHPRGFSGTAWSSAVDTDAAPLKWRDTPAYLQPSFETFGDAFSKLTAPARTSEEFSSRHRAPSVASNARASQPAQDTRISLSKPLIDRGLTRMYELPRVEADESLPDTIVEIQVGRSGAVFTCRISPSDQIGQPGATAKLAETLALKHARTLRFEPSPATADLSAFPPVRLSAGTLRYQWGYATPSETSPEKRP